MKTNDLKTPFTGLQQPGLQQPGLQPSQSTDGAGQVAEVEAVVNQAQLRGREIDGHQDQPVRLPTGPASSTVDTGQNAGVQVRKQQRSSGVRTKKLKTEAVGSMPRVARQAFNGVHDVVGNARQLLESKPRRTQAQQD